MRIVIASLLLAAGAILPAHGETDCGKNHYLLNKPCPAKWAWTRVADMNVGRGAASATLLADGRVLVAGGTFETADTNRSSPLASAEIFDPATGGWAATGEMKAPRESHSAIRLTSGEVLVWGGLRPAEAIPFAEIFDPASGTWRATDLGEARYFSSAAQLADGRILITGGFSSSWQPLTSAVICDPRTDRYRTTRPLAFARAFHQSLTLPSGKVAVFDGWQDFDGNLPVPQMEIYDPATELWLEAAEALPANPAAVLLPDGRLMLAGGVDTREVRLFAEEGGWSGAAPMRLLPSYRYGAFVVDDRHVLVLGDDAKRISSQVYDRIGGGWSIDETALLPKSGWGRLVTQLADGRILLAGGIQCDSPLAYQECRSLSSAYVLARVAVGSREAKED